MVKKLLYIFALLCVLANTIMIALNGLEVVEYRFNVITSYVSRVLITVLIVLLIMAIVNVRQGKEENETKEMVSTPQKEQAVRTHHHSVDQLRNTHTPRQHQGYLEQMAPSQTHGKPLQQTERANHVEQVTPSQTSQTSQNIKTGQHMNRTVVQAVKPTPNKHAAQSIAQPISHSQTPTIQPPSEQKLSQQTQPLTPAARPSVRSMDINVKRRRPRKIQL